MDLALRLLELGIIGGAVAVAGYLWAIKNNQMSGRRVDSFGPILLVVAIAGLVIGLLGHQGLLALADAVGLALGVAVGGGGATLLLGKMLPPP